ncbi:MAG: flavodoxin domain-containing protein [Candidatus Omnitrophica bacterium]|nr:flavodoxin domain-containing protein [Candidatus Omnitrophota bacterium]
MPRVLILYYSQTGNTQKMAQAIAEAMKSEGCAVDVRHPGEVKAEAFRDYDVLIIGSPTYYGTMAWELKKLLDESVAFHGSLDGKLGGAFSSAANIGGGNETTILDIVNALLIHGMVVQGDPSGDHYGPVSIGRPDTRSTRQCTRYGKRMAVFAKRLFP